MCVWIARRFGDLGVVDERQRRPYQSFDGELAARLEQAGIRHEMLVHDPESGELRPGIEGFLWLLGDSRFRGLARLLSPAPLRALMRLVYRTIAYNRRILAPPPRGIVCACDPDPHAGFRALFLGAMTLFVVAGAWLFGVAVAAAFAGPGAAPVAVLALLAALAAVLVLRVGVALEPLVLVGNALVILAGGVLVAAPGLALSLWLDGTLARLVVVVATAVGAWRCLASARRRLLSRRPGGVAARAEPNR
jgi:hypothetical protein